MGVMHIPGKPGVSKGANATSLFPSSKYACSSRAIFRQTLGARNNPDGKSQRMNYSWPPHCVPPAVPKTEEAFLLSRITQDPSNGRPPIAQCQATRHTGATWRLETVFQKAKLINELKRDSKLYVLS